jgi:DNA replication licensing factor MCM7
LIFLILDTPNQEDDQLLARHVAQVHQKCQAPKLSFEPFDGEFLRAYIAEAMKYEPTIPK